MPTKLSYFETRTEANEHNPSAARALAAWQEQIANGETMGVIQMYEDAYHEAVEREAIRAAYNAGHAACVAGKEISYDPHRGEKYLSRAWRNGWKDAADNSCTRGMDPRREYIEPLTARSGQPLHFEDEPC